MVRFFCLIVTLLTFVWLSGSALAMDCQQHLRIGYKLHTSKHSSVVAKDRKLLHDILAHYQEALKQCPDLCTTEPALCNNIGDVHYRLGNEDQAIDFFQEALQHRPGYVDPLYELGRINEKRGLLGSALDYFIQAHKSSPNDVEVAQSARKLTNKMCALSGKDGAYGKSANVGEKLTKEQLHDALVAANAFSKARERFNLCRRNIFVSAVALRNIQFNTGQATLRPGTTSQLQTVVELLKDKPDMILTIEGHTDNRPVRGNINVGNGVYCADNNCLSQERAKVIKAFLVARKIGSGRLQTKGFGSSQPLDEEHPEKNVGNGQLEIKASLANSSGDILGSDSIRIPASMVSPELLRLPQSEDKRFMQDLKLLESSDSGFKVTLITDQGRNNLSYRGDQTMTFYVKVNRPAFVRLFNRGADGGVYQIYPNEFAAHSGPVTPNELVAIPGENDIDFEFKVHKPFGNELVKVYASDKPLPDLPGQDVGYGFKKMDLDIKEIQEHYTGYATSQGVRLAQDVLPIVTRP